MTFDPLLVSIIDTPHFQRLRSLKQLGAASFVFPSACHTRFEHSLGVCHMAGKLVQKIKEKQPDLGVTDREVLLVQVAGLCHDLGHGPFSHLFESVFLEKVASTQANFKFLEHEEMSMILLQDIVKTYDIAISKEELEFIFECIGHPKRALSPSSSSSPAKVDPKRFLKQIVSNCQNSVDVDKFDYIDRDCRQLGVTSNFQPDLLMENLRVIEGDICFHDKVEINVRELFQTRHSLFYKFYYHKVVKSVELMIGDILLLANGAVRIQQRMEDPKRFLTLTDFILQEIEVYDCEAQTSTHQSATLAVKEAKELISRLKERDLYTLVFEATPSCQEQQNLSASEFFLSLDPATLLSFDLKNEEVDIVSSRLNFALGAENPLKHTRFFSKKTPHQSHYIENGSFSFPKQQDNCQETILRLYLKKSRKHPCFDQIVSFLSNSFRLYLNNNNNNNNNKAQPTEIS
jgi:HD superfamily phosphohydrolase